MNFSPEKILLVGMIALLVLGPDRLPHAARTAGKMLAEFRRVSASLQNEVNNAIAEPRDALNTAVGDLGLGDVRRGLTDARSSLRAVVDDVVNGSGTSRESGPALGGAVGAADPLEQPVVEETTTTLSSAAVLAPVPSRPAGPLAPDDPSMN